ncbi:mycothiol transferase [Flindersiella endophytica]
MPGPSPTGRCQRAGAQGRLTTPPMEKRWILAHLVEELARYAGHAEFLRELTDGSTGR